MKKLLADSLAGRGKEVRNQWRQQIVKENYLWTFSLGLCRICENKGCLQVTYCFLFKTKEIKITHDDA